MCFFRIKFGFGVLLTLPDKPKFEGVLNRCICTSPIFSLFGIGRGRVAFTAKGELQAAFLRVGRSGFSPS